MGYLRSLLAFFKPFEEIMYKVHESEPKRKSPPKISIQKKSLVTRATQKSSVGSDDLEKGELEEDRKEREKRSMIEEQEEKERIRLEKKKRTQEDMVADFVKILENMMNPRQAVTSLLALVAGIVSLGMGIYFYSSLPEHTFKARELACTLIIYGILQFLLASAYFVTCMQTSIAVTKGVKDASQILVGVIVAGAYVVLAVVSLVVGLFGFYKTLCICSNVNYFDDAASTYCPKVEFYTCVGVFVLHLITMVVKCCCCK